MKIPSIFRNFLLAATALSEISLGRAQAPDLAPPLVKVESTVPDNAGNDKSATRFSADNFFLMFADPPGGNGSRQGGMSIASTDILTLQYHVTPSFTAEAAFRTDWVNRKPGFLTSGQYEGLQRLDLQMKLKDTPVFKGTTVTVGTLSIWSPEMADPRTGGKPALLNNPFLFGGPLPGLGGVRLDGTVQGSGLRAKYTALAGTALRGLDSAIAGASSPPLCKGNTEACGLVLGGNLDLEAQALPGATFNTQLTHVSNGGKALNEWRTTLGGKYTHDIGSGITLMGQGEVTHGTNYYGGHSNLNTEIAKVSAEKKLTPSLTVQGYASGVNASGALSHQYILYGSTLTYHKGSKDTFSIEPYVGTPNIHGAVFKWAHTFNH